MIDNTVDQTHRNGLPPRDRDINPLRPDPIAQAAIDADPTHALHRVTTFGVGHHEQTPARIGELNAFHRPRGREIRTLEKQLPHDGYINTKSDAVEQIIHWSAYLLTLHGSLAEGDVRKGEITIQNFLSKYRWFNEYGKAYNLKEFRLNLSTTHASDLCEYASYQAYITGSNKILYLHEYFKAAVWSAMEAL